MRKEPEEPKDKESEDDDEGEDNKGAKPISNGGVTDKYTWTQTLSEVQVIIDSQKLGLPPGVPLKSRDLTVSLTKKKLKIQWKGKEPLVDGELHKEVKTDTFIWTIGDALFLFYFPPNFRSNMFHHRGCKPAGIEHGQRERDGMVEMCDKWRSRDQHS